MLGRRGRTGRVVPGQMVNGVLAALLTAASLFALIVLPLGPMAGDVRWAWLLLPLAALTGSHWALLHEAIHGLLHPHAGVNRAVGRLLAVLGGSSFRVLRFAHLMHHRFNRYRMDRPDCFDPAEISPARARLRYFLELFGGLYLIEVVTPLLFLLPRPLCRRILDRIYAHPDATVQHVGDIARQTFIGDRQLRELRQDAAMVAALLAAAVMAWGPDWPLLVAFLFARGAAISFMDNVYHYRTPLDVVDFAHNLRLPRLLRLTVLNINLHRVHHHEPHLPWWRLHARFRERADRYDAAYLPAALGQLRGPVPVAALAAARAAPREAA
jgi:fatty acid desaturase